MNKRHPLNFFFDFVALMPLKSWENDFYEGAIPEYDNPKSRKEGYIITCIVNSNSEEVWEKLYFKDVVLDKFLVQKYLALQAIENELMGVADLNNLKVKLAVLTASIVALIDKVKICKDAKRFPLILEIYVQLKEELENRGQLIAHWGKPAQKQDNRQDNVNRVKWLGQLNVLGTLFYDLRKGQGGGPPYIDGSVEDVKRMLVANFVDSEGHDLSKSTLDTIFMPSRSEKRANVGDRIELPNKKTKK